MQPVGHPEITQWFETRSAFYGLSPKGIVVGVVKPVHMKEKDAHEDLEALKSASSGRPRPLFLDTREILSIDRAARRFFAHDPEMREVETAVAMMVQSATSRMLANLYLKIDRPMVPYQMFTDRDAAVAWLTAYRR